MPSAEKDSSPEPKQRSVLETIGIFALVAAGVSLLLGPHGVFKHLRHH